MKKRLLLCLLCLCLVAATGCTTPEAPSAALGEQLLASFEAESLDGTAYNQALLAGSKLTMINVWGTFCAPCIEEMPALAALQDTYAASDLQIIGIPIDVTDMNLQRDPDKVISAKQIINETGADYIHLYPSRSLNKAFLGEVQSVPYTLFVNAEGYVIGTAYIGARSEAEWSSIIDALLESLQ